MEEEKIELQCPCDLQSAEECQICEDRKNSSLMETQQELIEKLFFENQMLRQATRYLEKDYSDLERKLEIAEELLLKFIDPKMVGNYAYIEQETKDFLSENILFQKMRRIKKNDTARNNHNNFIGFGFFDCYSWRR